MRKSILIPSLFWGAILLTANTTAQQTDRFAYAVTDAQQQGSNWNFLRKLNLQTGEYSAVLLSGNDASLLAFDAATKKQLTAPVTDAIYGATANAAFATGVAAMAYDKKNNRLYYTPMLIDQLRYLDLKTMKVFYVTDRSFTGKPQKSPDQGNIVTRMVIASDGNGYAMTNDGRQLIRFSTGKKMQITDLGSLVDDQSNNNKASIHSSCSSYGGDMIADDNGNLYVLSARNYVFKVNIETKVASYLGIVSGLPNGFTINGAAVNDDNQIIVSSAMQASSYFVVDHKTLTASSYKISGTVWQSSDLANSNLLVSDSKKAVVVAGDVSAKITPAIIISDSRVMVYPNPVTDNQFTIQFRELEAGTYTVQVTDVTGRQVLQESVSVSTENQAQRIKFPAAASKGVYLVKAVDANGKVVFSKKIIVQ